MPAIKLPRETPGAVCAIRGEVWNLVCDLLERALRITAGAGLRIQDTPAGKVITLAGSIGVGGIVPVKLVKDGGLNGGISSGVPFYATYTYSIFRMSDDPSTDTPLATGLTPQENRPLGPIIHSGGKIGDAIELDGSWVLLRVSEQLNTGKCTA